MRTQGTDFTDFLPELDAGVFEQKINRALSDVALGVVVTGKVGKVVITLDLKQVADSHQVTVAHSLKYVKPTGNGKVTEENSTMTPLYVGVNGRLTVTPDNQEKLPLPAARDA